VAETQNLTTLEQAITKAILKEELNAGRAPAVELLYNRYSGMLFSYILQFTADRDEAGSLLVDIFCRLATQLQEAFDSSLSVYCWLQMEARKIVLECLQDKGDGRAAPLNYYLSLLADASAEHQWVFRELFIRGRNKEGLALSSGKDPAYVSKIMRECLLIFRKNLG
jgi:hypothetical protein